MNTYNKIMQFFWLAMTTLIFVLVTWKVIEEGAERWAFNYIFGFLALGFFFIRRYMMKRMEKHQEFLRNKENNNQD